MTGEQFNDFFTPFKAGEVNELLILAPATRMDEGDFGVFVIRQCDFKNGWIRLSITSEHLIIKRYDRNYQTEEIEPRYTEFIPLREITYMRLDYRTI